MGGRQSWEMTGGLPGGIHQTQSLKQRPECHWLRKTKDDIDYPSNHKRHRKTEDEIGKKFFYLCMCICVYIYIYLYNTV